MTLTDWIGRNGASNSCYNTKHWFNSFFTRWSL